MQKLRAFSRNSGFGSHSPSPEPSQYTSPSFDDSEAPGSPTPMTMEGKGELSPEMAPIVTLLSAQANRKYHEGFFMLLKDLNSAGQPADRRWVEVYAILIGNELSYWDASIMKNGDLNTENKPSYINFSDAVIKPMVSLPSSQGPMANVIIVSTTLKNRFILQFSSTEQFRRWHSALRLAAFEYKSLQEAYTAALLSARGSLLSNIRVILAETKFAHEDWTSVRFGTGMPWKRCYCVIEPPKKRSKKHKTGDKFQGHAVFYESEKKNKKLIMATIMSAESVYAVYPRNYTVIDHSTMLKLDGEILFEKSEGSKRCSIFMMPEQHSAVPGYDTLIRFLIPLMDAFKLYGRPQRMNADKTDPHSLLFALPVLPNVHYLETQDIMQLTSSASSLAWDIPQWDTSIKQIIQVKMSKGYTGCGSADGVIGAVNFLDASKDMASGKIRTISASSTAARPKMLSSKLSLMSSSQSSIGTSFATSSETAEKFDHATVPRIQLGDDGNNGDENNSVVQTKSILSTHPLPNLPAFDMYPESGEREAQQFESMYPIESGKPNLESPDRKLDTKHHYQTTQHSPTASDRSSLDARASYLSSQEGTRASHSRASGEGGKIVSIYKKYAQLPPPGDKTLTNLTGALSLDSKGDASKDAEEEDLYPQDESSPDIPAEWKQSDQFGGPSSADKYHSPNRLYPENRESAESSGSNGASDDSDFQLPVLKSNQTGMLSPFTEFHESFNHSMKDNLKYPNNFNRIPASIGAATSLHSQILPKQQRSEGSPGNAAPSRQSAQQMQELRSAAKHKLQRRAPPSMEGRAPAHNVAPQSIVYEKPRNPYLKTTGNGSSSSLGYHTPVNQQQPPSNPPPLEQEAPGHNLTAEARNLRMPPLFDNYSGDADPRYNHTTGPSPQSGSYGRANQEPSRNRNYWPSAKQQEQQMQQPRLDNNGLVQAGHVYNDNSPRLQQRQAQAQAQAQMEVHSQSQQLRQQQPSQQYQHFQQNPQQHEKQNYQYQDPHQVQYPDNPYMQSPGTPHHHNHHVQNPYDSPQRLATQQVQQSSTQQKAYTAGGKGPYAHANFTNNASQGYTKNPYAG
ncbi:hypothetical protein FOA43_000342 [Brettanomyces nanus]|uniref:PH domain-containing protein n=1 Tax=Eeniella nana TaxID=13502 RepID=A0A875RWW2_EENNA|nr:uncharacterized protein FOA43_000342 [Brettanomyces nanus]QPG73038.1 hypothetical protein FOA43_000342 [Brettanomyces nanus]